MKYLVVILLLLTPLSANAQSVFEQVNAVRVENGVNKLKYDKRLALAAANHGIDFLSKGYFAHSGYESFIRQTGYGKYGGCEVGENLAVSLMPYEVINWWLDSPTHKANLLSKKYTHSGTAIIHGARATYIVQMFGNC